MPKRLKKGYFVQGKFVVLGSEADETLRLMRKAETQADPEKPSKTEKKNESLARQKLATKLLALPKSTQANLPLSDSLRLAFTEFAATADHAFSAKKRQLQFIGKLMRELDTAEVIALEKFLPTTAR